MRTFFILAGIFIMTSVAAMAAGAPSASANFTNIHGQNCSPCQPNSMRVCSLTLTKSGSSSSCKVTAKITVIEDTYPYRAVKDAKVYVTWTKKNSSWSSALNDRTGTDGKVSFIVSQASKTTYYLKITKVEKSGYQFNSRGSETTESIPVN